MRREIYFAAGCFWGAQRLFDSLTGVSATECGYANGNSPENAVYEKVKRGDTGFRETVHVEYDDQKTTLEALLFAFFCVIDSTAVNRQAHDIGSQYQAGIYYTDDALRGTVERIAALEAAEVESFAVEILPLSCFYPAEEYHQKYLEKNPTGYCHILSSDISAVAAVKIRAEDYTAPAKSLLARR